MTTEPLSPDEIAKKVEELTKGSAFDLRKEEKRRGIEARVAEMKRRIATTQPSERERVRLLVEKAVEDAERSRNLSHVMVHVDMDAFYASVEIRDQPDLADKPVAVGGNSMLSTCNYIARRYGARSAMPGFVAKKLCPHLVILPPDFKKYTAVARQVREVFAEYCPDFVSAGLDEAYLDITQYLENRLLGKVTNQVSNFIIPDALSSRVGCNCGEIEFSQPVQQGEPLYCGNCKLLKCQVGQSISFGNSAWSVVEEIRFKILLATKLTSSAGIAPNTMIAKIASDLRKPNGQYMVRPDPAEILQLMTTMAVAKVPFIGPVSQGELAGLGIVTCGDLRANLCDIYQLFRENHFEFFLHASLGIGSTELEHGGPRKSIGTETTFEKTGDVAKLLEIIRELCQEVAESLQDEQLCGRTLTLKLKTADFRVLTRAGSCPGKNAFFLPSNKGQNFFQTAKTLLEKEFSDNNGRLFIRLLGIRVSNLKDLAELEANNESSISTLLGKVGAKKRKSEDPDDQVCTKKPLDMPESEASNESTSISTFFGKIAPKKLPSEKPSPKKQSDDLVEDVILISDEDHDPVESSSSAQEVQTYACPICNAKFPRMTLARFNQHIDECLTRSAIRSIKEEDKKIIAGKKVPSLTRTMSNPSNCNNRKSTSPHKKPLQVQKQKSILSFLKPQ